MSLSYDTSRCTGNNCHTRDDCQRYTDRNTGPRTPFMTAIAPSENCGLRIPQPAGQGVVGADECGGVGHSAMVNFFV